MAHENSVPVWVYIIIVIVAIMLIAVIFLTVKKVSSENTEKRNSSLSIQIRQTYLQNVPSSKRHIQQLQPSEITFKCSYYIFTCSLTRI